MTSSAPLRILSLGAGVQSTTVLLLACEGTIPTFDAAIFADTGWEPAEVYKHLDRLAAHAARHGIPVHRVSVGNIRDDALDPENTFWSMPLFVRNPDGSEGMARRHCTNAYKLKPIKAKTRELLGYPHPTAVPKSVWAETAIGISRDEIGRAKDSDVRYMRNVFPLLDLKWTRKDCERYLRSKGWTAQKSACIGCPYHGNRQWRRLRDICTCSHTRDQHVDVDGRLLCDVCAHDDPRVCAEFSSPEWSDAVAFDAAIRDGSARARANAATTGVHGGSLYLHRSRVPLNEAPIDRVTRREWLDANQPTLDDALADEDMERAEQGDPDGCSPWACRSGEAVTS